MRVLIIEGPASSRAGGAQRTMRDFLEEIAFDHQIHLVYMELGEYVSNPCQANLYESTNQLDLHPITTRSSLKAAWNVLQVARLVRRHRIERIVTHMVHVSPFLRAVRQLTGVPYSLYFKWVLSTPGAGAKVVWGNAGADRAAAVSGFVRDFWIRNGVRADRFEVVPEGIDIPDVARPASAVPTIGFAGRLVPEKGLVDLLNAMPAILAARPETVLKVAGAYRTDAAGEAYRAEVEAQVARLGIAANVAFDGFVSPLDAWLAARDVVVVPSTCDDAQPIVMMQAMAAATPVVATRVGGIPEVLSGPFESLMVPPRAPDRLATAILSALSDPEAGERTGAALRERCVERYARPVHVAALQRALGLSEPPTVKVAA